MTDEELADLAVEILDWHPSIRKQPGYRGSQRFLSNWNVAGPLMVVLRKRGFSFLLAHMPDEKAIMTVTSPLPNQKEWAAQIVDDDDCRAIIEASVKALENES